LATILSFIVLAALRPKYRKVFSALSVIALLGGLLGAMQLANSEFFQERLQTRLTISNRLLTGANSLRMIRDYPFFGVGYFRFNDYRGLYNQGIEVPFYGYIEKARGAETPIHDIYLGRTAEEGLLGAGLLSAFLIVIIRAFIKKWRADPQEPWFNRDILALFAAIMFCFLIGGMFIDFRYFSLVNVIFFFLAGLIYGYRNREYGLR
jgi:O-antigen ligase